MQALLRAIESQLHRLLGPLAVGLTIVGQSNLGESEHDFRVPDSALHRPGAHGTWHTTPHWSWRSSPQTMRPGRSFPSTPPTMSTTR